MKNKNFYRMVYNALVALRKKIEGDKFCPRNTYDAVQYFASQKYNEDEDDQLSKELIVSLLTKLAQKLWLVEGEYGEYRDILHKIMNVGDLDMWEQNYVAFMTTKYAYQSISYQPISNRKVAYALLDRGLLPMNISMGKTERRAKKFMGMSQDQLDSLELHTMHFMDYGALLSDDILTIRSIYKDTGILPTVQVSNVHTGQRACFISLSLIDSDCIVNLRDAFPDEKFGVRIEHHHLGDKYEKMSNYLDIIKDRYTLLYEKIQTMKETPVSKKETKYIENELEILFFSHYRDEKEIQWGRYAFSRDSLWDHMRDMQKVLLGKGLEYEGPDGQIRYKKINKKRSNRINTQRRDAIISKLFSIHSNATEVIMR